MYRNYFVFGINDKTNYPVLHGIVVLFSDVRLAAVTDSVIRGVYQG